MKLPQTFVGIVVHGFGRGHKTVGFATANLDTKSWSGDTSEADFGVYSGLVYIRGESARIGVISIGKNPTFGEQRPTFEVHILDFDEDIYDVEMTVDLREYIRPMISFKSIDELKTQIGKDANTARVAMQKILDAQKPQ